jgi:mannose-6-phosphate isomerase
MSGHLVYPQPESDEAWAGWLLDWALESALPLWAEHGVDRKRGGFFDRLEPSGLTNTVDYKRLRVTARQIFVYANASRLGFAAGAEVVDHGLRHLLGPCRRSDGGFTSKLTHDGAGLGGPVDLYDNAFVLFALAQAYGLHADRALLDAAEELCHYIVRQFAHPAGGLVESLPPALPRRQNPHMHLLEALLAWLDLIGMVEPFASLAQSIVDLFGRYFFSLRHGLLMEYFTDDLLPQSVVAEPGHHFEWVWLLSECRRLGLDRAEIPPALYSMAIDRGLDKNTGLLLGEFGEKGAPLQQDVRIWPHTEWLRAEAVLANGNLRFAARAVARFLDHPVCGLWYENHRAGQGFEFEDVPASSLYHIMGAVLALNAMPDRELLA